MFLKQVNAFLATVVAFSLMLVLAGCNEVQRGGDPGSFPDGDFEAVSIYSVLANPDQYSERHIEVKGFMTDSQTGWILSPSYEFAVLSDAASSIGVNVHMDPKLNCNGAWVTVKGVTLPYRGLSVEFNPEKVHYISLSLEDGYCFATDEFKNSTGKVIFIEEGEETPAIELEGESELRPFN